MNELEVFIIIVFCALNMLALLGIVASAIEIFRVITERDYG